MFQDLLREKRFEGSKWTPQFLGSQFLKRAATNQVLLSKPSMILVYRAAMLISGTQRTPYDYCPDTLREAIWTSAFSYISRAIEDDSSTTMLSSGNSGCSMLRRVDVSTCRSFLAPRDQPYLRKEQVSSNFTVLTLKSTIRKLSQVCCRLCLKT